jgi:hypothetical protein
MSNYILDQLLPENHLYGFAIWQMLHPYLERGHILNQLGAGTHDPTAPQIVVVEFDIDRGDLPCDWHQYKLIVPINPEAEFYEQDTILVVNEGSSWDNYVHCTETSYKLPLRNLVALLPQLKDHASVILPCLPVYRTDESDIRDEDD